MPSKAKGGFTDVDTIYLFIYLTKSGSQTYTLSAVR